MSSNQCHRDSAGAFFVACESDKSSAHCAGFCHADANFSAQSVAIAEITTLAEHA
jgi:hypothetical protein